VSRLHLALDDGLGLAHHSLQEKIGGKIKTRGRKKKLAGKLKHVDGKKLAGKLKHVDGGRSFLRLP
jgi:hypothetical protein